MVLKQLSAFMKKHNISNESLAAKATVSAKTIFNAKKGRGINLNTGKRIAAGLASLGQKVKLDELV